MNRLKDWIIKKLGGKTSSEFELFRSRCEEYAVGYLKGRNGVAVDCHVDGEDINKDLLVIASNIRITDNCLIGGVIRVSPWVLSISMSNCNFISPTHKADNIRIKE